jgi:hypothetical protein
MPQQQTYLNNQSLSGINKVAIVVSVNDPDVSYSIISPGAGGSIWTLLLSPLIVIPAMGLEAGIRSTADQEHAAKVKEHMDLSYIEDKTAQSFMQPLKKVNLFKSVEQPPNKNQDSRQLRDIGYDGVIRLTVRKISIQRVAGDYVKLTAYVHGQMECLSSGNIIWDREEVVTNPEPHTLDYYKENGLKELDTMLEKAAKRLAYDFMYLK